jgi:outer membrane protein TolC
VAQEALTQAERNTVYDLRDFRRFQQTFTVSVASSFYGVLRQKDRLENQRQNYESNVFARESTEALAQAGRRPEFEVDQARQSELRAEDDLNQAIQSYNRALDNFKITLGLRTDANIELDIRELRRLTGGEEDDIPLNREEAEAIALKNRYDFLTARDELEDAERKVLVAENGFLPELNLVGAANFGSEGPNNVINVRPRDGTYKLGLELDLPFDRKEERNLYRQALITLDRTRRSLQEDTDLIKLDIRDSFRTLDQARESVDIQTRSVVLAERRRDSTNMLIEAGLATTRDQLDSLTDLLNSQNSLTSAKIDYNIAKLELLSNMGVLEIDESGMWKRPSPEDLKRMIESAENQGNADDEK